MPLLSSAPILAPGPLGISCSANRAATPPAAALATGALAAGVLGPPGKAIGASVVKVESAPAPLPPSPTATIRTWYVVLGCRPYTRAKTATAPVLAAGNAASSATNPHSTWLP